MLTSPDAILIMLRMEAILAWFTAHVPAAYAIAMFFCGAAVGSFLNVAIYRLPYEMSLLTPPSACPRCGKRIFGLDNLPIVSWFLLGGRCRACREPLAWRYPFVEFLTACLWAGIAWMDADSDFGRYTNAGILLTHLVFVASLVAITFIDFDHQIIPDEISLGGLFAGLLAVILLPQLHLPHHPEIVRRFGSVNPHVLGLLCAILGAAAGGGLLWLMRFVGTLAFRKQIRRAQETDPEITSAIGLGDVKLMAFAGALLGWKAVLAAFFVGTLVGAVAGIADKLRSGHWPPAATDGAQPGLVGALVYRWQSGNSIMPYGPFLAIGVLALLFLRQPILGWFAGIFAGGGQ